MSFLLDPPLLFAAAFLVHLVGKALGWERRAKIAAGTGLVVLFWAVSALLYLDVLGCMFPCFCYGVTWLPTTVCQQGTPIDAATFMVSGVPWVPFVGDVPVWAAAALFSLYILWVFIGYDLALKFTKRKVSNASGYLSIMVLFPLWTLLGYWVSAEVGGAVGPGLVNLLNYLLRTQISSGIVFAKTLQFVLNPLWLLLGYTIALWWTTPAPASGRVYTKDDVKSNGLDLGDTQYAVARNDDPVECVQQALKGLGVKAGWIDGNGSAEEAMKHVVKNGDRVLIKVNICGGVAQRKGTWTSTDVAGEVVRLVKAAGGKPFVCDADMIWTHFWPAAEFKGWKEWAEDNDVELVNLAETDRVRFDFGLDSHSWEVDVSKEIVDADVIITVPVMKTHVLTGITIAMKNMYGTYPQIDKAMFHKKGIEDVIYYVNKAFTPNLAITDGSIGGEGQGPLTADDVFCQTIIASNDVVCADAIACKIMGYDPLEDIIHLRLAHERNLGKADVDFHLSELPYPHPKDGNWRHPDREVFCFYNRFVEGVLNFPVLGPLFKSFFNMGADFLMYDTAKLPTIGYVTPGILTAVHDGFDWMLEGQEDSDTDESRRWNNTYLLAFMAVLSLALFVLDGYVGLLTAFLVLNFAGFLVLAWVLGIWMETNPYFVMLGTSAIMGFVLESITSSGGMWTYANGLMPPLSAVPTWAVLMTSILVLTSAVAPYLEWLEVFKRLRNGIWVLPGWLCRTAPFLLASAGFTILLFWEGYINQALTSFTWNAFVWQGPQGMWVVYLYAAMWLVGFYYALSRTMEWNAALMVSGIVFGGWIELIGWQADMWFYLHNGTLPLFLCIAWALNAFAVQGLAYLIGFDLEKAIIRGRQT